MERKFDVLKRMYLVVFGFFIAAIILFAKVVNISVIEGDKWREKGQRHYFDHKPIEAERGNILSDDGSFLATSLQFFDIRVDLNSTGLTAENFDKNIDSLAICLSQYVNTEISPAKYKNKLIKERKAGSRYLLIKRRSNYQLLEKIKKFPLFNLGQIKGGLIVEPLVIRYKPFKSMASRTIGEDRKNSQKIGLEGYGDEWLRGEQGHRMMQRVANDTWIPVNDLNEIQPKKGLDVRSTINVGIQDVASSALLNALEKHNAEYGVAIVMEVETGAIKAISNLKRVEKGYAELYNDAIGTAIEPGSTFKLATMMALMEDGLVDLDERVDINYGKDRFCGVELPDSKSFPDRMTTARHAFEISSNVGMARLVMDKYQKRDKEVDFIKRLKQFHLAEKTGIEIKGEAEPKIKTAHDVKDLWSCLSVPWMAIGYEILLTPLQILSFYNAVANDGKMMRPYLVSEILDKRSLIKKFEPTVIDNQIASFSTIEKAQKLLNGVMLNGTGKSIKLPFSLAGKTGTAQLNYSNKGAGRKKHQASFVGYFPADNPKYSCIVLVNDPERMGYYGSKVAGPVFREIALKCMNRIPEQVNEYQQDGNMYPLTDVGYSKDVETMLNHMGINYSKWTEEDFVVLSAPKDSLVLNTREVNMNEVPNVINMTLRDALYVLENNGFEPTINGSGRIIAQSVRPGENASDNKIVLTLQ